MEKVTVELKGIITRVFKDYSSSTKYQARTEFVLNEQNKIIYTNDQELEEPNGDVKHLLEIGILKANDFSYTEDLLTVPGAISRIKHELLEVVKDDCILGSESYIIMSKSTEASNTHSYKFELQNKNDCIYLIKQLGELVPTEEVSIMQIIYEKLFEIFSANKEQVAPFYNGFKSAVTDYVGIQDADQLLNLMKVFDSYCDDAYFSYLYNWAEENLNVVNECEEFNDMVEPERGKLKLKP